MLSDGVRRRRKFWGVTVLEIEISRCCGAESLGFEMFNRNVVAVNLAVAVTAAVEITTAVRAAD